MHVGIFGPTRCGKTTLAQSLSVAYRVRGFANLVCDPTGQPWDVAEWLTGDASELIAKAKICRRCMLWVEESSLTIGRDRNLSWLFTTAGNPNAGGHVTHVIGQDGSALLPGMRQQLSTVYLFKCHPDLAELWARQFSEPEIARLAPKLERYEFIVCRAYDKPKRHKLTLPPHVGRNLGNVGNRRLTG